MNELAEAFLNTKDIISGKKKVWYFAHPYTRYKEKDGNIITEEANIMNCIDQVNYLLNKGYNIYPPIIWTHQVHKFYDKPYDFWWNYNIPMMDKCDGIILGMDWEQSSGCRKEKEYFEKQEKEVLDFIEDIMDEDFIK